MSNDEHMAINDEAGRGMWPTYVALAAAVLVAFVVGVSFGGLRPAGPPEAVASPAGGCSSQALTYTVTNDPDEFARQQRFEREDNVIPKPGFYDRVLEPVATLHAAAHGHVVVFYRDGLSDAELAPLRALAERAAEAKAPVVISARAQKAAFVAVAQSYELSCTHATAATAADVRRFAADLYAPLAS